MGISPVEKDVLASLLVWGDDIPANIAERAGRDSSSVNYVMTVKDNSLADRGLIRNKKRGVYTLTDEGLEAARDLVDPFTE